MTDFLFIAFFPFELLVAKSNKMAIYSSWTISFSNSFLAVLRLFSFFLIFTPIVASTQPACTDTSGSARLVKEVRIPIHLNTVPDDNNFNDTSSEYCYRRSIQGNDIIIFWSREYGRDPMIDPDSSRRFDVKRALKECERFYQFYVDSLHLVRKTGGVTAKYKVIFLVTGGKDNTAYGWGQDSVGVLWTPASRMSAYPYGVLAHELGHAFQYLASVDYGGRLDGPITEMAAQYMLWQVYPEWLSFENYHLKAFMQQTHLAFQHPANTYHSPFVLEYWSEKYGKTLYSRMLHQAKKGEDIVTIIKQILQLDQQKFNDDMYEGVRRFITWDLPRIRELAAPYANQSRTKMNLVKKGWYRVDSSNIPQNYGYNGIRLQVPKTRNKQVLVDFKGMVKKDTLNGRQIPAGWRYGFVAFTKEGNTFYSDIGRKPKGKLSYLVPSGTASLWLVVMGAPGKYIPRLRKPMKGTSHYSAWPYYIKLTGTDIFSATH